MVLGGTLLVCVAEVVFGTQSPPIFQEIVGKTMLFKVLNRPVGMEKFIRTYPIRRDCDDAAIVGMFELSSLDLSPEKVGFVPKGEGSFGKLFKVTKSPNLGLTPSSCSELFAGSSQCTQKKSSVVDLGANEDAKCPLLKRKSADVVVDKLNKVDSSKNSCDEVDESEEENVVGLNQGSLDAEKDVKPSLKRLRRFLRLQFDEANESRGSGNDGSSGHGPQSGGMGLSESALSSTPWCSVCPFIALLPEFQWSLSLRYAPNEIIERAMDVLMHKRLLHLACDPVNRLAIEFML
ncbi:uncharacterized protein LOC107464743 [Arachis duranensis]|uniref:Uncharacterized protein LOC107464743 n=1 Tax=Arachis duranensis TaxID=130453 RepID=A0A9C6TA05_ARADU|nr:uncharacterized protein LOC107464743 [Arachis duranensis]